MFYECKICGYITNDDTHIKKHKCVDSNYIKIEKFKRCLRNINIFPKNSSKSNER